MAKAPASSTPSSSSSSPKNNKKDTASASTSSSPADEKESVDHAWWRTFSARQVLDIFAGCVAYPLETIARQRQQMIMMDDHGHHSHVDDDDDDDYYHLYAGVWFHMVKIVTSNVILAVYQSEALTRFDFLRRVMMKLFHS
eukprot:scaffold20398_cov184-Amphora_coffeaeformis.AAC.8